MLFDPRPLARLDATIIAEHEGRPAVEQQYAAFLAAFARRLLPRLRRRLERRLHDQGRPAQNPLGGRSARPEARHAVARIKAQTDHRDQFDLDRLAVVSVTVYQIVIGRLSSCQAHSSPRQGE
jgi:hypothetical protein